MPFTFTRPFAKQARKVMKHKMLRRFNQFHIHDTAKAYVNHLTTQHSQFAPSVQVSTVI